MKNIFLSFCGADREVKNNIKQYLLSKDSGLCVFESDEFCTSDFSKECIEKIEQSQVFVSIISEATMDESTYCINEIICARKLERMGKLNILLFKLCQADLRGAFEFQLNGRSDLNNLTRGTTLGYEKLGEKIAFLLESRENNAPVYEDVYTTLSNYSLAPAYTKTRWDIADSIHQALENGNAVILKGRPGIGRTYAAKEYIAKYEKENLRTYRVDVDGGLRDFILSVNVPSANVEAYGSGNEELRYASNLQYLEKTARSVLIVAKNVNIKNSDSDTLHDLKKIGARVIIITSSEAECPDIPVIEVPELDDGILNSLFFNKFPCDNPEEREQLSEQLPELYYSLGYHTSSVVFVATRFREMGYGVEDVTESIEKLNLEGDEVAGEIIKKFFDFEALSEAEKDFLFYMACTPYGYDLRDSLKQFFKKMGVRDFSGLDSLKEKGYIDTDGEFVEIVGIIVPEVLKTAMPSAPCLYATVGMLMEELANCGHGDRLNAVEDKLGKLKDSYDFLCIDEATAFIKSACEVTIKVTCEATDKFFEQFVILSQSGIFELEHNYVKSIMWESLTPLITHIYYDKHFGERAEETGYFAACEKYISPTFRQDYLPSGAVSKDIKELLVQLMGAYSANGVGEVDSGGIIKKADFLMEHINKAIDEGDSLEPNSVIAELSTLMRLGQYNEAITFIEKIKKAVDTDKPEGLVLWAMCIGMLATAYYSLGLDDKCYEYAEEYLEYDINIPMLEMLYINIEMMLIKIDLKREAYDCAARRIEQLLSNPNVSGDIELFLFDCYANIQMFNGNWYKLYEYIDGVINRFDGTDSEHIDSLKLKLAECGDMISSIENVNVESISERDVTDASEDSLDYYYKLLKSQIGQGLFNSCSKIAEAVIETDLTIVSDSQLKEMADKLRAELKGGKLTDSLIIKGFSLVREAGFRMLGIRHNYIQLIAAVLMLKGYSTEIRNGEGKTFTIVLVAAMLALCGRRVDVITSGEYLSDRDYKWMREIYKVLGIAVGYADKRTAEAFDNDVTYTSANNLIFYYADKRLENCINDKKVYDCAIVDEADLIMIDRLRTPYTYTASGNSGLYSIMPRTICDMLDNGEITEEDFVKGDSEKLIIYPAVYERLYKKLRLKENDEHGKRECRKALDMALYVFFVLEKDVDYHFNGTTPYMEDVNTGMSRTPGTLMTYFLRCKNFRNAKYNFVSEDNIRYVLFPDVVLNKYKTVICTSGTMQGAEKTFKKFYNVTCVNIPTNKRIRRKNLGYTMYFNAEDYKNMIVDRVLECLEKGRPVLVVAPNTKKQQVVEQLLAKNGIAFNSVNYINEREASEIFAIAGVRGAVTVTTNIGGRGVDIVLGGNPNHIARCNMRKYGYSEAEIEAAQTSYPTRDEQLEMLRGCFRVEYSKAKEQCVAERQRVLDNGGLYVLGTFLMESVRHEEQLRGRAGRQGEPGTSEFIVCSDDENVAGFFTPFWLKYWEDMSVNGGMEEGLNYSMLSKAIIRAQKQTENNSNNNPLYGGLYLKIVFLCEKLAGLNEKALTDNMFITKEIQRALASEEIVKSLSERVDKVISGSVTRGLFGKKERECLNEVLLCINPSLTREIFNLAYNNDLRRIFERLIGKCREIYDDEVKNSKMIKGGVAFADMLKAYEERAELAFEELWRRRLTALCRLLENNNNIEILKKAMKESNGFEA